MPPANRGHDRVIGSTVQATAAKDPGADSLAAVHTGRACIGETAGMLLVDAANVVGSRPNGWWRDRPGAARDLVDKIQRAVRDGRVAPPVVVVVEGVARRGAAEGDADGVQVIHAPGSADDRLVRLASQAMTGVIVVSADGALRRRVQEVGAEVVGPRWLLSLLDE